MALPKRLYYPLDMAAEEVGCKIRDLFHFAANGKLEICTRLKTDDTFCGAHLAIPPQWIMDEKHNISKWGKNQEPVFATFIRAQDYSGFMRIVRYGEHLAMAEAFDCLFAIAFPAFSKLDFEYQDEIFVGNSYITLPRGSKYSAMVKDGDDRELDHTLGADEEGNLFFITDIQKSIPVSTLVITESELELFKNGGKQMPKMDIADEIRISPKAASADLNIIGALFDAFLRESKNNNPEITQTKLIEFFAETYKGYYGLSESSLKRKIPLALNSIQQPK